MRENYVVFGDVRALAVLYHIVLSQYKMWCNLFITIYNKSFISVQLLHLHTCK